MIAMSIASMATQMQQDKLQSEVSTGVARMGLDAARAQGDAMVQMIEQQKEIYAHLGGSVNSYV